MNETGIFADVRRAREQYEESERNQSGFVPNRARALVKEFERLQKTGVIGSLRRDAHQMRQIGLLPAPVMQLKRLHREMQDGSFGYITSLEGKRLIGEMKQLLEDNRTMA